MLITQFFCSLPRIKGIKGCFGETVQLSVSLEKHIEEKTTQLNPNCIGAICRGTKATVYLHVKKHTATISKQKEKSLFSAFLKISVADTQEDLKYFSEEEVDEERGEIDIVFGRGWSLEGTVCCFCSSKHVHVFA